MELTKTEMATKPKDKSKHNKQKKPRNKKENKTMNCVAGVEVEQTAGWISIMSEPGTASSLG